MDSISAALSSFNGLHQVNARIASKRGQYFLIGAIIGIHWVLIPKVEMKDKILDGGKCGRCGWRTLR
jgi:hypothetical protein